MFLDHFVIAVRLPLCDEHPSNPNPRYRLKNQFVITCADIPLPLPIPNIFCQTFRMRTLTTTPCLTIAVLLEGVGVSWGADWNKGLTAYQSGDYATDLREWKPIHRNFIVKLIYLLRLCRKENRGGL